MASENHQFQNDIGTATEEFRSMVEKWYRDIIIPAVAADQPRNNCRIVVMLIRDDEKDAERGVIMDRIKIMENMEIGAGHE